MKVITFSALIDPLLGTTKADSFSARIANFLFSALYPNKML
jgi:hypothetical protein